MIQEALKETEIEKGEIQDCLLHLYRVGQIYCEFGGDRNHPYIDHENAHYLINFKGKVFLDTIGGYEAEYNSFQQQARDKADLDRKGLNNQVRLNILTLLLAVGTLGYLFWSMRFFLFHLLHWC
ncbi:MAG TPA: hypothetical protein VK705_05240 [Ferruginibacter sp.]|nr:hypothetical protein [Ferruginibacter sp.]